MPHPYFFFLKVSILYQKFFISATDPVPPAVIMAGVPFFFVNRFYPDSFNFPISSGLVMLIFSMMPVFMTTSIFRMIMPVMSGVTSVVVIS